MIGAVLKTAPEGMLFNMIIPLSIGVYGVDHNDYSSYQIMQTGIGDVDTKVFKIKKILTVR